MSEGKVIVTGCARHTLGEAFIRTYLARKPQASVISIDRIKNRDLSTYSNLQQIEFDLNPLNWKGGGIGAFANALGKCLSSVVTTVDNHGVEFLLQCAGVYDYGELLEHNAKRRSDVLGVNVLGVTEVLHNVMSLNKQSGRDNAKEFTSILVGSYQGLYAKELRPIYASSKAYGIDLCTSLVKGQEVAKCVYLAVGPIDTPMLHRNHWVKKAQGSEQFYKKTLNGPSSIYKSIFMDCDEAMLLSSVKMRLKRDVVKLRLAMKKYFLIRQKACSDKQGVLRPEDCAAVLTDMLTSRKLSSGVYGITSKGRAKVPFVKMAKFARFDRRKTFESFAKPWQC